MEDCVVLKQPSVRIAEGEICGPLPVGKVIILGQLLQKDSKARPDICEEILVRIRTSPQPPQWGQLVS